MTTAVQMDNKELINITQCNIYASSPLKRKSCPSVTLCTKRGPMLLLTTIGKRKLINGSGIRSEGASDTFWIWCILDERWAPFSLKLICIITYCRRHCLWMQCCRCDVQSFIDAEKVINLNLELIVSVHLNIQ